MYCQFDKGVKRLAKQPTLNACCRDAAMGLTLDPQLIRDLTVLITSSTVGGMVMEALRQPVINGYFIAGSVVGPGGLRLVKVRAKPNRLPSTQQ